MFCLKVAHLDANGAVTQKVKAETLKLNSAILNVSDVGVLEQFRQGFQGVGYQ